MQSSTTESFGTAAGGRAFPWELQFFAAVCLGYLVLIWAWQPATITFTVDDTYYYLKTACNLAGGFGPTFDRIALTNGFHPLWMLILVLLRFFSSTDMDQFARLALSMQVFLVFLGTYFLSRIEGFGGRRLFLLMGVFLSCFYCAKILINGLETALQFFFLSAAMLYWQRLRISRFSLSSGRWLILGLLVAAATLARLSAGLFAGMLLLMPVIWPTSGEARAGLARRIKASFCGLSVLTGLVLAYCVWNVWIFGQPTPVSGAIKFGLDAQIGLLGRGGVVAVNLIILAAYWVFFNKKSKEGSEVKALFFPVLSYFALDSAYNFGLRGEFSLQATRIWYLLPSFTLFLLYCGYLLSRPLTRLKKTTALLLLAGFALFTVYTWGYRINPKSYSLYQSAVKVAHWLDRHTAKDTLCAAWDAGYVAGYTQRRLINLDGLINSWDYKKNYLSQGRVNQYIIEQKVDCIAQYMWPWTLERFAKRIRARNRGELSPDKVYPLGRERWQVDLSRFWVAHVEVTEVSVAYKPSVTIKPVYYFVLSRKPAFGALTFESFALERTKTASARD